MRTAYLLFIAIAIGLMFATGSCNLRKKRQLAKGADIHLHGAINQHSKLPFDSNLLIAFYKTYPLLSKYEPEVLGVYRQHRFNHIWYDNHGVVEFGQTLFGKIKDLDVEGVSSKFPYQQKVDGVFENEKENALSKTETELMLTNLYLFYAENVYKGLDDSTTMALGWLLPRKEVSYSALLDSIKSDPVLLNRADSVLFNQYYKLRDVLQEYREIEKRGGWKPIDLNPKLKAYKPGDTAEAILQIKERLFVTGEMKQNNKTNKYDSELEEAVMEYQQHNGNIPEKLISRKHIREMNIPVSERIKKIIVNMERCRWISPEFAKVKEYIVVNIPSFRLNLIRDGKNDLESPVVVGKNTTKTVIFSGMLSYIVFSPYWNLPQSIINKEVKPGMKKNKNYLEIHNMEWNNGQVRQKPGKNNSLGLIKFIFPNSNDIYMHDTPAKSLFGRESRAFSHGCIRVGKPRELAIEILRDDPNWTPGKIDAAMHAGIESSYSLKNKIPVYIAYLTTWVDHQGKINFYEDIYERDDRLAELLISE
ncbi:MAG: L,D-transpeptidase family protein [Bacteroidales bacterium]